MIFLWLILVVANVCLSIHYAFLGSEPLTVIYAVAALFFEASFILEANRRDW